MIMSPGVIIMNRSRPGKSWRGNMKRPDDEDIIPIYPQISQMDADLKTSNSGLVYSV
jgi:hypothetical protein